MPASHFLPLWSIIYNCHLVEVVNYTSCGRYYIAVTVAISLNPQTATLYAEFSFRKSQKEYQSLYYYSLTYSMVQDIYY